MTFWQYLHLNLAYARLNDDLKDQDDDSESPVVEDLYYHWRTLGSESFKTLRAFMISRGLKEIEGEITETDDPKKLEELQHKRGLFYGVPSETKAEAASQDDLQRD